MAGIEAYAPCPCGSGEKYKWCCQKVEPFAEKAERLARNGQAKLAIEVLDEGLRKDPGNPLLSNHKASILLEQEDANGARAALQSALQKRPTHVVTNALLIRCVFESQGPIPALVQLQRALEIVPADASREPLGVVAYLIAVVLEHAGSTAAALAHLRLATLLGFDAPARGSLTAAAALRANVEHSVYERNEDELLPAPGELEPALQSDFDRGRDFANRGLWSRAAEVFDDLQRRGVVAALFNLGLCRLWLMDDSGAVSALRDYTSRVPISPESVDIEALCQLIDRPGPDDSVERVMLTWTLRDRDRMFEILRSNDRVVEEGRRRIDPEDPESFEGDSFVLLDRPKPAADAPKETANDPLMSGRLLVGNAEVALEAYDDGSLDALTRRFTNLAGLAIAPAHPRTKVLAKLQREDLVFLWTWWEPAGLSAQEVRDLRARQRTRIIRERWMEAPRRAFGGRTPRQAAADGNAELRLRAAVCAIESTLDNADLISVRQELRIPSEPDVNLESTSIDHVHISRLHRIAVDRLSNEQLAALFRRAIAFARVDTVETSAREMSRRPNFWEARLIDAVSVYTSLANLALMRNEPEVAAATIVEGRALDPDASKNAVRWDLARLRVISQFQKPEQWVPELAVLLERHRSADDAGTLVLTTLLQMGLVQASPNPDRPDQVLIDTRTLSAMLSKYGPRITTADGSLGVGTTTGGIWTPESAASSSGGAIWTPGSPATSTNAGGDKPKLIVPG